MTEPHLSGLTIARLATDESEGLEDARAHLVGCPACRAKLEAARAERDALAASPALDEMWAGIEAQLGAAPREIENVDDAPDPAGPVPRLDDARGAWARRWRIPAAAATLALAAVALLMVVRPTTAPVNRLKGDAPRLSLYDPATERPIDGLPPPGLDFRVRAVCKSRCVVRLFHQIADRPPTELIEGRATLRPGQVSLLGLTARLDDAPTPERLVALFCEAAPGPEALRAPAAAGCTKVEHVLRR